MNSKSELATLARMKEALSSMEKGKGVAKALMDVFQSSPSQEERELARKISLGMPVEEALEGLGASAKESIAMKMMTFVVMQARFNAHQAATEGTRLSELFEKWITKKKQRVEMQRVMETRAMMVSGIMGGIGALIWTLSPVLASLTSLGITLSANAATTPLIPVLPWYQQYEAMLFVVPGALFLGLRFSPGRAYVNVMLCMIGYVLVAYFFGSLLYSGF